MKKKAKTKKTVVSVLRKALSYVQKGWCQGAAAKDSRGEFVEPRDKTAVKWCIYGAILKAGGDHTFPVVVYSMQVLRGCLAGDGVTTWNDRPRRHKSQVVCLMKKAIAFAKEQGV